MDVEKTAGSRLAAKRIVALSVMAVVLASGAGTASAQQMSLPGKFAVSSSGAATYDIAIAVPPGTAGMVPSLKLSYSSHGVGNGLLGASWTLSGLPSIGRCAKTVAQDGSVGAITFTSTDMFCMDGQRLIAFNGGAYGVDGTAYRTEIESFNRVIQHGTPAAWFEVHTKAGQIMEFGNTPDSLILAQGTTVARNWALNKVRDTKGNYLTVTYTNDAANGQAYPSEIDYTGNTAAGVAPYNKVQFVYLSTPRPDTMIAYQAGSFIKTNTLLTNVKTYAGASLVADYRLAYQQSASTNASEITSVTLCDAGGNCLPSTRFGWSTGFDRTNPSFTALTPVSPAFGVYNFGSPPANDFLPLSGDFNGDGLTDWMMIINQAQHVFLSNGDGTFAQHDLGPTPPAFGPYNFSSPPQASFLPITGDFNGDGLTDWMMIINTAQHVFLSNGDGTFTRHDLDPAFGSSGGFLGNSPLSFGSLPTPTTPRPDFSPRRWSSRTPHRCGSRPIMFTMPSATKPRCRSAGSTSSPAPAPPLTIPSASLRSPMPTL
jgi:Salmonella virulence plasmid 65kDa B protein/FG-GAP-like repeat